MTELIGPPDPEQSDLTVEESGPFKGRIIDRDFGAGVSKRFKELRDAESRRQGGGGVEVEEGTIFDPELD